MSNVILDMVAGDDWELQFNLKNPDGSNFDLTGDSVILWTLVAKGGCAAIDSSEVSVGMINAAAGELSILVPSTVTTRLRGDFYCHVLRVIFGGVTATPFSGQMYVIADPWALPDCPPFSAQIINFSGYRAQRKNYATVSVAKGMKL